VLELRCRVYYCVLQMLRTIVFVSLLLQLVNCERIYRDVHQVKARNLVGWRNRESATEKKTSFSVLTFNLWGMPRKGDKKHVLEPRRAEAAMRKLHEEVDRLKPNVIAFQEYNDTVFDKPLRDLWEDYRGCKVQFAGVKMGVRHDTECRVGHEKHFEHFEGCTKYARKYISVEIKVGKTWVSVAGLHLISGRSTRRLKKCKIASLGYSFGSILKRRQPGIVMGDLNWFSRRGLKDVIPMRLVPNSEYFIDAAQIDARVTFPAWDQDLQNPTNTFAARLDRVFYTTRGLRAVGYTLVNKRAVTDENVDAKYSYISDHVGSFVKFEVLAESHTLPRIVRKWFQWGGWPKKIVEVPPHVSISGNSSTRKLLDEKGKTSTHSHGSSKKRSHKHSKRSKHSEGSHGSSGEGGDGSKVSTRSRRSKGSTSGEGSKGSKGSEGSDGSSGEGSDGSKVGTRSTRSGSKGSTGSRGSTGSTSSTGSQHSSASRGSRGTTGDSGVPFDEAVSDAESSTGSVDSGTDRDEAVEKEASQKEEQDGANEEQHDTEQEQPAEIVWNQEEAWEAEDFQEVTASTRVLDTDVDDLTKCETTVISVEEEGDIAEALQAEHEESES